MEIENGIIGFTEEKKQVAVDGKEYVVRNLTPIYRSEEDRERVKRRIEKRMWQNENSGNRKLPYFILPHFFVEWFSR